MVSGTVLRARSGFYTVRSDDGRTLESRLRGRVKKERQASELVVIGDRVTVAVQPEGGGMIEAVEPRSSKLSRRQPGPRGSWREDLLVANVDQVLVVFACADPMPHLRMVDRFLVVAEHNQVDAVVVANKIDTVGLARARELFGIYEEVGYPVHYLSAREGMGIEQLADRLAGRTSVVAGPSGVGKSTLLNAVQPGLHIATGDVSLAVHKGQHTTTAAELHPLDSAARRLRRRHAGAPGAGPVADPRRRTRLVLPGVPRVPGPMRLQRLPPPRGAALRDPGRRGGRCDPCRAPRFVPEAAPERRVAGPRRGRSYDAERPWRSRPTCTPSTCSAPADS